MALLLISLLPVIPLSPALANEGTSAPPSKVIFGGDSSYPPFEWLNRGIPAGFNVDLARQVSQVGGAAVQHKLGSWSEMELALRNGEIDILPMFISEQRQQEFQFTTPFFVVSHAIYGTDNQPAVGGIEYVVGKSVAMEELSFAHKQLITENLEVNLVLVSNALEALEAVTAGTADFALLTESTADLLIDVHELPLSRASPPFWPRDYAFAVRKADNKLHAWLQESLNSVFTSGDYQEIYEKWEPDINSGDYYTVQVPFYIGYTAIAAILLMTTFLLWSWILQRRLRCKTAHLNLALSRAKQSKLEAKFLAEHETETGLPRPHHFCQLVDDAIKSKPTNCELLIFKLVYLNEVRGTLGQSYSKDLITFITSLLDAKITGPCCYYGRGIFAVFSDSPEIKEFFRLLSVNQAEELPYSKYVAGSASFPDHGTNSDTLLSNADSALSVALTNHKDWVLYDCAMAPDPRHQEIIAAFRGGSLKGMHAVFQAQVDIESEEIIGAEALVRWQHPTLGFLTPDIFIPLVEKLGFVSQVTALMIDEAMRIAAKLRRENRPMTLSVNVSALDLAGSNFVSTLKKTVKRHKGQFCDLKLELTETSFSNESERISEVLQQLKDLGVKVSIDDFGTGYSSLAYLSMFPIQELKIDRSFVSNMLKNIKNCNIIKSTLVLADHLNLKTVAEGVEDEKTLELLRELGCDCAQGYFISKPLPEADFLSFLGRYMAT
ncbi:EAL domain, c-di-GMP-specific phosphodiesterase class I (or its enzymatically inactive variant) [Pseudidiomarina planktonica]|uniref:EAL domain, c-di-GMP-specific phosphodiesterase class I (Or its enzymatically inactive variant) n=1 Tax=Pseudidiomarina planktonica TaxID=1323738 RepID=A0A1Y6EUT3_9GAMM|nr:EAL domain-containing protein [Pseudidiomarina planktonica]SMQ66475.1 EAL domain, c-di-GMP-specific phosphodiesterase class I (or its enzymatically inactive variant) [Pseudidiomarina planktonica]